MKLTTKQINLLLALLLSVFVMACDDDDEPGEENEEEVITDVTLTFTPATGAAVTATATDPDGEGPQGLQIDNGITLTAGVTYTLAIDLQNSIENESITEEIEEEDDEHMFFFEFTNDIFSSPAGNGNVDARDDAVINYNDQDGDGLPLGLSTEWTAGAAATGTFRVILKHQPNIKTATSTATDGESDIDLSFNLTIQ